MIWKKMGCLLRRNKQNKRVKHARIFWHHWYLHGSGVLSKLEAGEGLSGYTRDRSGSGWDDNEDGRIDAFGSFAYSDLMILPSTHQEVYVL